MAGRTPNGAGRMQASLNSVLSAVLLITASAHVITALRRLGGRDAAPASSRHISELAGGRHVRKRGVAARRDGGEQPHLSALDVSAAQPQLHYGVHHGAEQDW